MVRLTAALVGISGLIAAGLGRRVAVHAAGDAGRARDGHLYSEIASAAPPAPSTAAGRQPAPSALLATGASQRSAAVLLPRTRYAVATAMVATLNTAEALLASERPLLSPEFVKAMVAPPVPLAEFPRDSQEAPPTAKGVRKSVWEPKHRGGDAQKQRRARDAPPEPGLDVEFPLPLQRHFAYPELLSSFPGGFEAYRCQTKRSSRFVEVHVMPLADQADRAIFEGQVKALRADDASYLGWRRDRDVGGRKGLLVTEAAESRLSDIALTPDFEEVWSRFHVGVQLSASLLAMSRAGYVHGAVEPGNVWVSRDSDGRILRAFLSHRGPALVKGSRISAVAALALSGGSEMYMAPELRDGTGVFTDKSDVYSLGAMLFGLLVGHPPEKEWMHSAIFDSFCLKFPGVGQLLLDCLRDPHGRITLDQMAWRLRHIYGEEHADEQHHVARADTTGLPPLCTRTSRVGVFMDRICRLKP